MKNRILAMLMAAALCLGIIFSAAPMSLAFSDVQGDTLEEAVAVLNGMGIVDGYSDGKYHPEDGLTRAQFCKLIVTAQGKGDQAAANSYRTLFQDLASGHWAAGYINLAYSQGLVSGYGDGRFGPDDPVTLSQAVTIVLRTLGYATADIGPFWPEDYLSKAAELGLTDGITAGVGSVLTRGDAAMLLYAMLQSDNKSGKCYGETLGSSLLQAAILLDNDAESELGEPGMAKVYANGAVGYYEQVNDLPDELLGVRGTVLLNQKGAVVGLLPDGYQRRTVAIDTVTAKAITDTAGSSYTISSSTPVLLKGEKSAFSTVWYSLEKQAAATLYYNASGTVDFILAGAVDPAESAYVVTVSQGAETLLRSAFQITGSVNVRKNGQAAVFDDIAKYDVVTYDAVSRTLRVSDRKITGLYENVSPNVETPSTVTVLGARFDVLDQAQEALAEFEVGNRVTLLLTEDGMVAGAYKSSVVSADNIGIYDGNAVTLLDGTRLSGTVSGGDKLRGAAVKVSDSSIGKMTVCAVSGAAAGALDLTGGTVGKYDLAPGVVFIDQVGGAAAVQLEKEDLKMSTVSSAKVDCVILDQSGQAKVVIMSDATGDCYTYGVLESRQASGGSLGGADSSYTTVAVTNSEGTGKYYSAMGTIVSVGGLAPTGSGGGARIVSLTKAEATRGDFDLTGNGSVVADNALFPISTNVQVYNTKTKQWITLEEALAFTDEFTVYYDRNASLGGQIRVIYAE